MNLSLSKNRARGTALLIVMALLFVMCVLMFCAARSITFVKSELKLTEQKQIERCKKGITDASKPVPQSR